MSLSSPHPRHPVERSQKEIDELREELARAQKAQRDERRVRLLLEDKCKELRSANGRLHVKYTTACKKVTQIEARMEAMQGAAAAAAAAAAPQPPTRNSVPEKGAADTAERAGQPSGATNAPANEPVYDVAATKTAPSEPVYDVAASASATPAKREEQGAACDGDDEGESRAARTDSGRKKWGSAQRKSARASLQVRRWTGACCVLSLRRSVRSLIPVLPPHQRPGCVGERKARRRAGGGGDGGHGRRDKGGRGAPAGRCAGAAGQRLVQRRL